MTGVGSVVLDHKRGIAMWPEGGTFALFGEEYAWVRECPQADMLRPGFNHRALPLTLHRIER